MDDGGDLAAPDVGLDAFEGGEAIDALPSVAEDGVLEPPTLEAPTYAMELREETGDLPPVPETPVVDEHTGEVADQGQMATGHGHTLPEGPEIEAPERSASPELQPWSIPGGAERRG